MLTYLKGRVRAETDHASAISLAKGLPGRGQVKAGSPEPHSGLSRDLCWLLVRKHMCKKLESRSGGRGLEPRNCICNVGIPRCHLTVCIPEPAPGCPVCLSSWSSQFLSVESGRGILLPPWGQPSAITCPCVFGLYILLASLICQYAAVCLSVASLHWSLSLSVPGVKAQTTDWMM